MARGVILLMAVAMVTTVMVSKGVKGDVGQDTAECADQLSSMATCLQYVQGQAKAPTPDCCTGLKQVLSSSKKCLCVIVKDGNDPQLGLNINVTLALGLPAVCKATANVTQCPALLHLDPNSPESQIFYNFGKTNNSTPSASSPGPAPEPVAGGGASSTASAPEKGNATAGQGRARRLVALFGFMICSYLLA